MIFKNNIFKDKPLTYEKWQEVFLQMATHTQGMPPKHLFKARRPLEIENAEAMRYREENFKPITKGEFDKAINDYIAIARNLDVNIVYRSENDKKEIENVKISDGIKNNNIYDWYFNFIARYRQTDPNAVVVVLPKHTTQTLINNDSSVALEDRIPNFNSIINQKIDVDVRLITYNNIIDINEYYFIFVAGSWEYRKGYNAEYYFKVTKDETTLIIPVAKENTYEYKEIVYYKNKLNINPYTIIGGKLVKQIEDNNILSYYISDFSGAVAWGDLAIGQIGDLQICEVRFTYPRHWRIKIECDNRLGGCHYDDEKSMHCTNDGSKCQRCNGTGYIMDTTPLGTLLVDNAGAFMENGKFQEPEGFISPDTAILKHSGDRIDYYFGMMLQSLGILSQNMTNQSGLSKQMDMQHIISQKTIIVTDLYLNYVYLLNIINGYFGGTSEIDIIFPQDFDVKNADDILYEITEAKSKNLPNSIIVELTKKYLLKKFGNTAINNKIINFLSIYDKLFIYGIGDISQNQIAGITDRDFYIHNLGFSILQDKQITDRILSMSFQEMANIIEQNIPQVSNTIV